MTLANNIPSIDHVQTLSQQIQRALFTHPTAFTKQYGNAHKATRSQIINDILQQQSKKCAINGAYLNGLTAGSILVAH